jgi:glycosyltransferase involved in cell wall biosynthesis
MDGPLVSAIIPTYNYGRFVVDAVESALGQTYRHVEVLVVDDGSTDDTRERLAPFGDRIRYIYQENQGLSAARNTGIGVAKGHYIGLLDSDDVWGPRKIEVQIDYLQKHPEVALLATEDLADRRAGWPEAEPGRDFPVQRLPLEDLVLRSRFSPSSAVIRKEVFAAVGLFDTGLKSAEDRDMWLRIACRFPVAKVKAALTWYRYHGGNMSYAAGRMEENEVKVLQKAFRTLSPLQNRWAFRQQALSYAAWIAGFRYEDAGSRLQAVARMSRSFLLWPFSYRASEMATPIERLKSLVVILMRLLRIRRSRPRPEAIG